MVSNTLPEHESNTSLHDMEKKQLADQLGDIHYKILPIKKLLICLFSLSLALFLSFVDQTSVTIALATIGKRFECRNNNQLGSHGIIIGKLYMSSIIWKII